MASDTQIRSEVGVGCWSHDDQAVEAEVKDQLMRLPLAAFAVPRIVRLIADPNAGFVIWEAMPPAGVPHWKHNESLLNAFATALAFCGTDMRHDWVVLGEQVLVYVRSLPSFKCFDKPVECPPLCYVGVMCAIDVYIPMTEHLTIVNNSTEFYAGTASKCSRGKIQNAPMAMNR